MRTQVKPPRMMKTTGAAALRLRLVVTEHQERMGKLIRARREELGLSRDEVARRMSAAAAEAGEVDKTNGNAIYRYELGEVTPGPRKLDLLAQVLKTQVVNLMMEEPAQGTANLMDVLGSDPPHEDRVERLLREVLTRLEALEQLQDQLDQLGNDARATWLELAANDMEVLRRLDDIAPPKQDRPPQGPR